MIGKYFAGKLPSDAQAGGEWPARCDAAVAKWERCMEVFDLAGAARCAMDLLRQVDVMINDTEPFKLAKDPANTPRLSSILNQCAQTVRIAGVMLEPFLPQRMKDLATAFGGVPSTETQWASRKKYGAISDGHSIEKVALFPRVDATSITQAV